MRPWLAMAVVSMSAIGCAALALSEAPSIPASLGVPDGIKSKDSWQQSSMVPLEFSLGEVKRADELSVSTMIQEQSKSAGTVMFAVRRPG